MKTVCFGEIMLRLKAPGHERLMQTPFLEATFGGGEANVAVSLAHYGHDAYFISKLPNNDIGESALKVLRAEKVNVDYVARGGNRVGIYYLETGASMRASNVVYDETAENCRDIYGVFVDKKAICGGYSKAFSYLCDKVGIETITVTGDADGEAHMWNMVKLDGEWYNVDCTWDDPIIKRNDPDFVRHDYLLVKDSEIEQGLVPTGIAMDGIVEKIR